MCISILLPFLLCWRPWVSSSESVLVPFLLSPNITAREKQTKCIIYKGFTLNHCHYWMRPQKKLCLFISTMDKLASWTSWWIFVFVWPRTCFKLIWKNIHLIWVRFKWVVAWQEFYFRQFAKSCCETSKLVTNGDFTIKKMIFTYLEV